MALPYEGPTGELWRQWSGSVAAVLEHVEHKVSGVRALSLPRDRAS
jgi:hypothetical protein